MLLNSFTIKFFSNTSGLAVVHSEHCQIFKINKVFEKIVNGRTPLLSVYQKEINDQYDITHNNHIINFSAYRLKMLMKTLFSLKVKLPLQSYNIKKYQVLIISF